MMAAVLIVEDNEENWDMLARRLEACALQRHHVLTGSDVELVRLRAGQRDLQDEAIVLRSPACGFGNRYATTTPRRHGRTLALWLDQTVRFMQSWD